MVLAKGVGKSHPKSLKVFYVITFLSLSEKLLFEIVVNSSFFYPPNPGNFSLGVLKVARVKRKVLVPLALLLQYKRKLRWGKNTRKNIKQKNVQKKRQGT